ncbi:phospholipid/cholesterol/gamma-HCH transport system permease protein [Humidesulfovibrio mexicanus]|uniref:Phospholipid/cholesterol/gamma-HCH transport system permease protein n=2 Tax=Humidesulfovibrio mexicanus TaxID=147047 RepID=A0A238XZK3_9BACT|nr:phospholipid/cholesterol/gamma-HCH transport system permease protein [Humidesulfovibrio mexicanus]
MDGPGSLAVRLSGELRAATVARLWEPALARVRAGDLTSLQVKLDDVRYIDGSGLALLVTLRAEAEAAGVAVSLSGLPERYRHLLELAQRARTAGTAREDDQPKPGTRAALEHLAADLRLLVSFVGESALVVWNALRRPRTVRWKDVLRQAVAVGVESLPILLLIGFLMGMIMSFQSVITLQRFGGEIYVPNMLGLVMFREMGPLVTAILLAARSGSAFAAEIGTMHVNEELDALSTMGISPVRFLVGPRLLSSLAVVPVMTLFFNFASLVGGALVMVSIGFPLVTFTSRVFANVTATDLIGSLIKILVFSVLVTGVSCLKGLRTGGGADAVGRSTTGAVVAGLILITVADGLFAVLFYYFKF